MYSLYVLYCYNAAMIVRATLQGGLPPVLDALHSLADQALATVMLWGDRSH